MNPETTPPRRRWLIVVVVATAATLTIAVATGGHVAEVELFAVTGARC